ncbi:hypothetical protein I6A60_31710 [Frankia sp. AgB1.9]|uniref:Uncharacterized protein n=1 Tax=Pseudofrankia inefficax (strain DSM 45817 / CECT 9037 / DDB 130130 / EuI1c) TaxID=298654 RepID=E3J7A9_PSEI1|nr:MULTISPECIES: hypothetical protein [Frankiaceae]ADP78382.1 hypothetical protein FraEuI1c_0296 [Pseudofrankia inefficax]MBL7493828.1 hypothetical protein [Frankia sp. AgW1.1]MBL7552395.1 hypothetical protein [Frankia sp. AgB1.9]MBL7619632.1 hypothetical protein [Frankia sp. AgB1.8]
MQPTPLVTVCGSGGCPTVFTTEDDAVIVQGYLPEPRLSEGVPTGEARVVIPRELLNEAARRLLAS